LTVRVQPDRILQLQTLRFFAAGFVLIGHALMEAQQQGISQLPRMLYAIPWGAGVDLFFVISGFIIFHIQPRAAHGSGVAIDFMIRRLIRLAPMYWLFTMLMIVATVGLSHHVEHHWVDPTAVVKSFLFIPYVPDGYPVARPILGQGWTLNYEMFFYAASAGTLLLARRRAMMICAIFLSLTACGLIFRPLPVSMQFWFEPILIEFVIGILLAANRARLPKLSRPIALAMIVAALVWFVVVPEGDPLNGWDRLLERGVPSALLVFATLQIANPPAITTRGLLPLLGDASYALYLSHTFATNIVSILWEKLGLHSTLMFVLLGAAFAISASLVLLLAIERPLLKAMTLRYDRSALRRWLSEESRLRPLELAAP